MLSTINRGIYTDIMGEIKGSPLNVLENIGKWRRTSVRKGDQIRKI